MKFDTAMPYFPDTDIKSILTQFESILKGEGMLSMGANVDKFERQFSEYVDCSYSIATASCTGALEILLMASGVGNGDEVIIPSQTFIATASAVVRVGARPVFCEVNNNFLLDSEKVEQYITPKTKAVLCVHYGGLIDSSILNLYSWLRDENILLFEDASHAIGARIKGKSAGNISDGAAFSFYATKNMTTGEGGMITTNDKKFAEQCQSLRGRGRDISSEKEIYTAIGTNQRMTEIQALMGLSQLKRLDEFVQHRGDLAEVYIDRLSSAERNGLIGLIHVDDDIRHPYWRFVVFLKQNQDRIRIARNMAKNSIKIDWAYDPLVHLQPIIRELYGTKEGMLPYSENLARTHVCLPIHVGIDTKAAEFISECLISQL